MRIGIGCDELQIEAGELTSTDKCSICITWVLPHRSHIRDGLTYGGQIAALLIKVRLLEALAKLVFLYYNIWSSILREFVIIGLYLIGVRLLVSTIHPRLTPIARSDETSTQSAAVITVIPISQPLFKSPPLRDD
jgi:hypothetical protein